MPANAAWQHTMRTLNLKWVAAERMRVAASAAAVGPAGPAGLEAELHAYVMVAEMHTLRNMVRATV